MRYLTRLRALADLTPDDDHRLVQTTGSSYAVNAGQALFGGQRAVIIFRGWAGLIRVLPNGLRIILQVALPGDVVAPINRTDTSWLALTDMALVPAPEAAPSTTLASAYQKSVRIDVMHYEAQIVRCGFMDAAGSLTDLLVEVHARLALAGQIHGSEFSFPLSQTATAEMLGLTSVHVNRTRRAIAESGVAVLSRRDVKLGSKLMERSAERKSAYLMA